MAKSFWRIPHQEVVRQCAADNTKCDANSPIRKFDTLEPCISGGKKILSDSDLTDMLKRIYMGSGLDE